MTPEKLVSMALDAMQHAYAPYSGYKVGAALLCKDGSVVCGANIENAGLRSPPTAPSARPFLRRCLKASGTLRPSPLWAARTALRRITSRPAEFAGR